MCHHICCHGSYVLLTDIKVKLAQVTLQGDVRNLERSPLFLLHALWIQFNLFNEILLNEIFNALKTNHHLTALSHMEKPDVVHDMVSAFSVLLPIFVTLFSFFCLTSCLCNLYLWNYLLLLLLLLLLYINNICICLHKSTCKHISLTLLYILMNMRSWMLVYVATYLLAFLSLSLFIGFD